MPLFIMITTKAFDKHANISNLQNKVGKDSDSAGPTDAPRAIPFKNGLKQSSWKKWTLLSDSKDPNPD